MMGGGGNNGGNGGDAERWLVTAQKLLLSGDLNGSKTYAIRACEADHSLVDPAELILAVADTLIAGESRIRSNTGDLPDWYAVLRLVRLTHNPELVATQYSRLAVLLNPSRNRFPYSDQAFRLISDAWYVLSDPSRKAVYDRELHLSQFGQLGQLGFQLLNQPSESPQHQQQEESPQHQTVSYQNQQLPFQLHQHSHFAQPPEQRSQFNQQVVMQQQYGQEQSEMIRSGGSSSSSGRDWRLPVEEERCINLNNANATERVQPSRRFHHDQERSSSGRSYEEASSQRALPSTDLTWSSKPTPTSEHTGLQSSGMGSQFQPPRSTQAAQLSLLSLVSEQPSASQPNRSAQTHSVSKPQPVSNKLFPMSQPSSNPLAGTGLREAPRPFAASKPFSGSQSSQKSKPFAVSQPPTNSKPCAVSQRSLNSNPFPVSELPRTSNPFPASQSTPNTKVSQVSQPPPTSSNPFRVSQPPPTSRPTPVSQPQPQPPPTSSNPFLVSQPTAASKPLPVSQQHKMARPMPVTQPPQQAFQSTSRSQPPESSGGPSPLPPTFNSTQPFQSPPVSTTLPQVPAATTTPSHPPPVSQPTWVPNETQHTEQTPTTATTSSDSNPKVPSFWTTCPYCFVLYEYPSMYEESVLKCQTKSCRRAFQAVKVPSPPPVAEEDSYYCCWGFYPIGFVETAEIPVHDLPRGYPVHDLHRSAPRAFTDATKIPSYDIPRPAPKKASRKVDYNEDEDDDEYIDSDPSEDEDDDDDDWHMSGSKRKKNVKQSKQKASTKPKLGKPQNVIQVD